MNPGWKGWQPVADDYLSPSDNLISVVPHRSSRTQSSVSRPPTSKCDPSQPPAELPLATESISIRPPRMARKRLVVSAPASTLAVAPTPRERRRPGWKGWVEVADDYMPSNDRMLSSVRICRTRTRSGHL
jgi:hypothetical protein